MGKRKRRMSLGTAFMLLLTVMVVTGCVVFLTRIAGDEGLSSRSEILKALTQRQLTGEITPKKSEAPEPLSGYNEPALLEPASQQAETAMPVPEATEPPSPRTITLAAAGTVYAPKVIRQGTEEGSEHYNFAPVFEGLGDVLREADLAIVTLETTTAGKEKGYGNYNTPVEILDGLRAAGADLVAMATERALDKGYEGLDITVGELTARGLSYAGVNPDGGEIPAAMMRVGGVQIAVLSYTYGISEEGSQKTQADSRGVVAMMEMERMAQDITRARIAGANVVVVLPHWGTKNKSETPENVRAMARSLAQAGADIILGTHPNVVQGTERLRVRRSDGLEYETVVCYSLGSLLNDARAEENTAGMVAGLSVTYDPVSRRTTLGELSCTPIYIARMRENGVNVYRVVDARQEQALAALNEEERLAALHAAQIVNQAVGSKEEEE